MTSHHHLVHHRSNRATAADDVGGSLGAALAMTKARSHMSSRSKQWWRWLVGAGMLNLGGCTGVPVVDVQLIGLPADTSRVEVTAELDSASALEGPQSLTPALDRVRLELRGGTTGIMKLHVSAVGRGNCEIAAGDGILQLHGALTESVALQLGPKAGCRIDVAFIGSPGGVVQFGGNGPLCSADCQVAARRDERMTLSFLPTAGSVLGGWFAPEAQGGCSGRGTCTILVPNGVTTVQVTSLRATSCAASSWCLEESTPPLGSALYGLWGASRESIWAIGDAGALLHSDGFAWSSVSRVTARGLRGIWGSGPNDSWAVGESGTMLHYDGQVWTVLPRVTTSWLLAIWGSAGDDVWAVGDSGTILHWNGTQWSQRVVGVSVSLRSVWGSSPNSVWAVGDSGTIVHYDGTSWSSVVSNTGVNLYGVGGSGAQNIWVVGDFGTALHLDSTGMPPTSVSTGTSASLRSVFVPSADASQPACAGSGGCTTWAAGVGGVMVPLSVTATGTLPVSSSFDPTGVISNVWGPSGKDVWAVGQGSTIVRYRPQ